MTVGSGVRTVGAARRDGQSLLLLDLIEAMTRDIPSIGHMLEIIEGRLGAECGMRAATVFTLNPDDGSLLTAAVHGDAGEGDRVVAGLVFRSSAPAAPVPAGDRTAIRLRIGGQTLGVLVLTGDRITALRADVAASIALHLASTLQVLAAEQHRQYESHATATLRRLFEEGTVATGTEDAGRLLARATGEAFHTEHAAVHLADPHGRIYFAAGIGIDERMSDDLRRNLVGRQAGDSPMWQAMLADSGPILVGDTGFTLVRPSGFVQTMRLRSFIAMPLLSAAGPAGVVLCGDSSRTRHWSGRDHTLARQLAIEGGLIVDSARMRREAALHVAELTRQAYHDALTGLPNRPHLMERAEQELEVAMATGGRLALLLLDLDGFKRVNDTSGHHAGDVLLQAVGERLQSAVRDHDVVARLGGDEFAILLTRDPDKRMAAAFAERIHAALVEPFAVEDTAIRVGASIGIARFPADASDMTALMRGADAAMYRAKRKGGGIRTS